MAVIFPFPGSIDRGSSEAPGANRVIQIRTWTDGRTIFEWEPSAPSISGVISQAVGDDLADLPDEDFEEASRRQGEESGTAQGEDGGEAEGEADVGDADEESDDEEADEGVGGEDRCEPLDRGGGDRGDPGGSRSIAVNPLCLAVVAAVRAGADLTWADLSDADLRGADLSGARLAGAWLEDADLGRARLTGACLDLAILRGADLEHASLVEASLRGADLSRANLDRSTLRRSDLSHSILCSAWLDGADLRGAVLADLIVDEHTTSTCLAHFFDEDRLVQAILDVDRLCRRPVAARAVRSGRGASAQVSAVKRTGASGSGDVVDAGQVDGGQDVGWLLSASSETIARRLLVERGGFRALAQEIEQMERVWTSHPMWVVDQVADQLDDAYGQVLGIATLRDRTDVLRQLADHLPRASSLCVAHLDSLPAMRSRRDRWEVMRVLASHRSADVSARRGIAR